jgi:hypothetical protein
MSSECEMVGDIAPTSTAAIGEDNVAAGTEARSSLTRSLRITPVEPGWLRWSMVPAGTDAKPGKQWRQGDYETFGLEFKGAAISLL